MTQEDQIKQLVSRILENIEFDISEKDVTKHAEPLIQRKLAEFDIIVGGKVKTLATGLETTLKKIGDEGRQNLSDIRAQLEIQIGDALKAQSNNSAAFKVADMKRIADEVFQTGFTQALAANVAKGQAVPLPPLLSVDPTFVEDKVTTVRIDYAIRTGRHLMGSGPSGAGKTFPMEMMLRKHGRRYLKVSVADGLAISDFLAKPGARATGTGTETFYTYGFLPLAMLNGMALLLDEIDQCQPEIVSVLNAVLETGRIFIPQTGETIEAKPGFQVFMTCNTLRDDTGNYSGFRLNAALLNRVTFVKCDYLPAPVETGILVKVGLIHKNAEKLVGVFNGLRRAYEARKLTHAPSTRLAVRVARCMLGHDDNGKKVAEALQPADALGFCLLDGLPESELREASAIITNGL